MAGLGARAGDDARYWVQGERAAWWRLAEASVVVGVAGANAGDGLRPDWAGAGAGGYARVWGWLGGGAMTHGALQRKGLTGGERVGVGPGGGSCGQNRARYALDKHIPRNRLKNPQISQGIGQIGERKTEQGGAKGVRGMGIGRVDQEH
jgi:hypothetical protein